MNKSKICLTGSASRLTQILVLATSIFSSGCAHQPLLKEWDWSIHPDHKKTNSYYEEQRKTLNQRIATIEKENPKWKNMRTNDEFSVDLYDANGVKNGSATIR